MLIYYTTSNLLFKNRKISTKFIGIMGSNLLGFVLSTQDGLMGINISRNAHRNECPK